VAKPDAPEAAEREREEDSEAATPDAGPEAAGPRAPVRFHSRCVSGISSRKRDGGLYEGCPHALRIDDRVRYSRSRARVMPTYASRRSSSSSLVWPRARMCGKTPSSMPVRNTTGNSRPLAVWRVISVITPDPSSSSSGIWSESATSATRSRKAESPPGASPSPASCSNSRATAASSWRFSMRVSSCGSVEACNSAR
jgi:hypothetical protein